MLLSIRTVVLCVALASTAILAGVALADSYDHDAVRLAVERGEIRSLADILTQIRDKLAGQIAGVEIERKAGRWLYELRVVSQQGQLLKVYVDARTGEIERIKEK